MQFRPGVAAFAVAAFAAAAVASPGGAATLRFSGGVATIPTDYASYLLHVYCTRPGPGAERGASCRAMMEWAARNSGRDRAAWSPAPSFR